MSFFKSIGKAVSSAVSSVAQVAHDVVHQPLKGFGEAVTLPIQSQLDVVGSAADIAQGIPFANKITAGAQTASEALRSFSTSGKLPDAAQTSSLIDAASGIANAAGGLSSFSGIDLPTLPAGFTDFGNLLNNILKSSPSPSYSGNFQAGEGSIAYAPPPENNTAVFLALAAGVAFVGYKIVKG